MAKRRRRTAKDKELADRLAQALERGRLADYVEQLQNTRTLLWRNLLIGLARGFGAIIGATVVVALVVTLLGVLGDQLPGELGDFFTNTSKQIQPSP